VGKSTVLCRVVEVLKAKGYRVGGMISREMRANGTRVGFELTDVFTGQRGVLAHVSGFRGSTGGQVSCELGRP
jgi:nucleoside-triphosphatase